MGKEFTKARLEGTLEIGVRTCHWKVSCSVSRFRPSADPVLGDGSDPELIEIDDLDLRVEVFSHGDVRLGEYEGAEVPDAEVKYWEGLIRRIVETKVSLGHGVDETNWSEGEE